jgi:hypothetical protein
MRLLKVLVVLGTAVGFVALAQSNQPTNQNPPYPQTQNQPVPQRGTQPTTQQPTIPPVNEMMNPMTPPQPLVAQYGKSDGGTRDAGR